ncbi:N-formylglutamate amidohydrolase [Streptomyces roseirectus]|uniref:N-formylglutamate amidohydrolase n=1 Tax=Streptomyces roseirectus TaxID=2768066 RepID=A0A7H0IMX8_9ACTN|nr:N-formylglutamate amidohydrolase [Streptomyces roseirectus]QNP74144.1 N-formylglutamate amidohydrolase [Streptomyces roseirectus]
MTSAVPPSFVCLPGAKDSPVILHVPHSAREIPAQVRTGIVLGDAELERESDHIVDAWTAEIARDAAGGSRVRPWRFVNLLSRLVVDPERFLDEREEMRAVGMGAVYTRTTHREVLRDDAVDPGPLVERYFRPYARAMTEAVRERVERAGRAVVIDVHSYPSTPLPYELHGDGARPAVCLGTDPFHTPPALLDAAETAFAGFEVGLDSPFSGTYVPLEFYGSDARVTALMIEVRRDVYMTEPGGPAGPGLGRVARALAALVDAVSGPRP